MITLTQNQIQEMEKLVSLIRELNTKGHNVATSGNYSLKFQDHGNIAYISESGVDKSEFRVENFLPVDITTNEISDEKLKHKKPSDETALHTMIYQLIGQGCVLHSHFINALVFADLHLGKEIIELSNLEMIKAFRHIKSHEETVRILCFPNTQDISALSKRAHECLKDTPNCFAILLRHHGIYAWGKDVKEAKRHLEALEYIFDYTLKRNML